MTILLLIVLIAYAAVVSAPISMRAAGLILAQRIPRATADPGIDDGPFRGAEKSISAALNGSDATGTQSFGTKM